MNRKDVLTAGFLISLILLTGCGGGGGGGGDASPTAAAVTSDPLAASIVGTWTLDQEEDDFGVMHSLQPNSAGGTCTITFNGDGSGIGVSYDRTYTSLTGVFRCKDGPPQTGAFTWTASGSTLSTKSAEGNFLNTVRIEGGLLHQTLSDGSRAIWRR